MEQLLLQTQGLKIHYPVKSGWFSPQRVVKAVDGVDLKLFKGETLGLVGESGCGKSSLAKAITRLNPVTEGVIEFRNRSYSELIKESKTEFVRNIQMIFQDPYSSLNPRKSIYSIISQPLIKHNWYEGDKEKIRNRVLELLDVVGLGSWALNRYPHEFSGGQRQRIAIARAISLNPELIVCDEPVSALDVSVQAQVLNLLMELKGKLSLSYLFIAHDLAVVQHVADKIGVMYLGQLVELANKTECFTAPKHPYTQFLLGSVPEVGKGKRKGRITLKGDVPSPLNPPTGCTFHTRCPFAMERCAREKPTLKPLTGGNEHVVACHAVKSETDYPQLDWKKREGHA